MVDRQALVDFSAVQRRPGNRLEVKPDLTGTRLTAESRISMSRSCRCGSRSVWTAHTLYVGLCPDVMPDVRRTVDIVGVFTCDMDCSFHPHQTDVVISIVIKVIR